MQSRAIGAVVAIALVIAAVVLFVVLRDDAGDDAATTATTTTTQAEKQEKKRSKPEETKPTTIVVKGGQPVGGIQDLEFTSGEEIQFQVRSDVAEEIHVHGYDVIEEVAPGKDVEFDFPAEIEGGFEVELEGAHVQIAELTVRPG